MMTVRLMVIAMLGIRWLVVGNMMTVMMMLHDA